MSTTLKRNKTKKILHTKVFASGVMVDKPCQGLALLRQVDNCADALTPPSSITQAVKVTEALGCCLIFNSSTPALSLHVCNLGYHCLKVMQYSFFVIVSHGLFG